MSDYTLEQLREYPLKDRWTPEESLATIEKVEDTDCIHGIPLPYYVESRKDRVRWANCVRIAAQIFGDTVSSPWVQQTARLYFVEREKFTDD